jgi:hypothetical protein
MSIVPRFCTIPGNAGKYAHAAPFIVNQPAARLAWRLACLRLAADIPFRNETPAFCHLYAPGDTGHYIWSARRTFLLRTCTGDIVAERHNRFVFQLSSCILLQGPSVHSSIETVD